MTSLISLKDITKVYGESPNETVALAGISLEIKQGEFVEIIGPSGSGKSTLMHIVGLLDQPTAGKYLLNGKHVSALSENRLAEIRNKEIGFVFQSFNLLARTSALKNVMLPLIYSDIEKGKREEMAKKNLEKVGLGNRLDSHPNQLSGGQQQRVAIARALINNPSLILADEPTGNLDTKSTEEIMQMLKDLNKQGHSIVIITHEDEVAQNAKRIITIRDGKILSDQKKGRKK